MKYIGMPFGMWALFAPSFRKQLTAVFGYDANKIIKPFKASNKAFEAMSD